MDDFTDDEAPPQIEMKHAAKKSDNVQDKLLASGDEREEYTGKEICTILFYLIVINFIDY